MIAAIHLLYNISTFNTLIKIEFLKRPYIVNNNGNGWNIKNKVLLLTLHKLRLVPPQEKSIFSYFNCTRIPAKKVDKSSNEIDVVVANERKTKSTATTFNQSSTRTNVFCCRRTRRQGRRRTRTPQLCRLGIHTYTP